MGVWVDLSDATSADAISGLRCDVAVVGGGPVGLAVAIGCAEAGLDVLVIESGGAPNDGADQMDGGLADLATGERAEPFSMRPVPTQQGRQVGGNAPLWHLQRPDGRRGVRLVELDDIDFDARDATGGVGWPFPKAVLRRWYRAAAELFGIEDFASFAVPNGLETAELTTGVAQVPLASTVWEGWVSRLRAVGGARVVSGATVVGLQFHTDAEASEGHRVSGVEVATLSGARTVIAASQVILAGGGYDNARLMLSEPPRRGTPLGDDAVTGRFLADHPLDFGDYLRPVPGRSRAGLFPRSFDMHLAPGHDPDRPARIAYLTLRPEVVADRGLLGMSTWLYPRTQAVPLDAGPVALRALAGRGISPTHPVARHGRTARTVVATAGQAARHWRSTASWLSRDRLFAEASRGPGLNNPGWPDRADGQHRFSAWELVRIVEQPLRHANRVRLSPNTDRLGRRRVLVDWRWDRADAEAALATKAAVDAALGSWGTVDDRRLALARPGIGHVLGCTRMHVDPAKGVVDADCRVHGTANLYVAGTSTFPTGGWANPTYTAVALALRLANHLATLQRPAPAAAVLP